MNLEKLENLARRSIKNSTMKIALGKFAYLFLPKHNRVALASFPRSGNTWLRVLLESATGQLTGSIYKNDGIHSRKSEGLVVKTHSKDSFRYAKAIVMIRNPFDSLESYFAFKQNYFKMKDLKWQDHLEKEVQVLKEHTLHWQAAKCEKVFVRFEDLKSNPQVELQRIFDLIGMSIADEDVDLAVANSTVADIKKQSPAEGQAVIRSGLVGKGIESFSEEQQQLVENNLKSTFETYGYF